MEQFNPFSLVGKQILVTGASSGIGKGIALACAKMGATVIITGRNVERLNETLSLMSEGDHKAISADLTKAEDIDRLVSELPKLDGLVQCAGVGSRVPCKQISKDDIAHVMQPNMEAPILLQTALLSKKKINKASSIVYIASRAYQSPSMGNAVYSASKGAIVAYAKCLALELASRQIRVNCVCPGMVWTDLITNDVDKETLEGAQLRYPLKRFGTTDDVANLAIYLLSDASGWMTGSCVDISGGGEGVLV
ncbi:SDR family NAD(P)-dependent oxidoreductase [Bacteroides faecium]|uniref:SDR family oxidoreductase n=1 Tax=Bacteroides faecium TaxID=2715212 RepID=A0A6H0KRW7_9BACE|nr:SDR family oxidoreductase [Bacteroides faecium]QIU96102.1 SDR family oxidoreductase [Bacteroides faecium]